MTSIIHIAGYKFITLENLSTWKSTFLEQCQALRGTILLSHEGINVNIAGFKADILAFREMLLARQEFLDMTFHETHTEKMPYQRMKVKLKKEIIAFRKRNIDPEKNRAPHISAEELKKWLDENRDFTLLDTRNTYEIEHGTFTKATNLNISDFSEFCDKSKQLDPNKIVVMYCTGGIRCEKAGIYLKNEGFQQVYQLDGGILKYFKDVGQSHFEGKCFVFDERIALNINLLEG